MIADIEEPVIAETVAELSQFGPLDSFITDVADETSVEALSEYVFDTKENVISYSIMLVSDQVEESLAK